MTRDFRPHISLLKVSEGGSHTQRDVRAIARRLGIEVRVGPSGYVGHFTISVRTEDKRKLRRLENAVF